MSVPGSDGGQRNCKRLMNFLRRDYLACNGRPKVQASANPTTLGDELNKREEGRQGGV